MKKGKKNQSWGCLHGYHSDCHGKILSGSPTQGVKGIHDCKCDCHGSS